MNKQVTEYIESAVTEQRKIMEMVRALIHQQVQNVTEDFKWSRPIFKTTKNFAYFLTNKNYVTIGFTKDIDRLSDPGGRLEGTGKTMRHIKVKKVSDIDKDLLKDWFISITRD